ncbi:MAG: hypothetical protein COU65_03275 [Candidatus Pacebacteria bacterium CG10_big_fil_rev_8_21_14_0_10_42_12]|nr:bifunctional 5,10-methylenetetrahydrofolate dehydrogenase/5,10-methenyltetrahydrofolate cyclohydrolase [Candidatus Paceibacterota bacterium]PIR62462.1 MAG: hypothetical protein COU65_03275 [Candidatus Pacebacteria bacterium CG10_big_fil_rev_8_21_14_0_10_42_12]
MKIFDGYQRAGEREKLLAEQVTNLQLSKPLVVRAILFSEDAGSVLYTGLKREAADRLGIIYETDEFSLNDFTELVVSAIKKADDDEAVTGIIVQKPSRAVWQRVTGETSYDSYKDWWLSLTSEIDLEKDVDGLHPDQKVILPATCKAVLYILAEALGGGPDKIALANHKVIIIGKSDLLGNPLYRELKKQGAQVELLGKKELSARMETGEKLLDATVIVSATGERGLITGDMISEGVVLIDVGEPHGDVDRLTVGEKPSFITPVPGGVGPMTVVSLMENVVDMLQYPPSNNL